MKKNKLSNSLLSKKIIRCILVVCAVFLQTQIHAQMVSTFAGSGVAGSADGTGTTASFYHAYGVAIDDTGNVYVADTGNHKIRKITSAGVVTTIAGSGFVGNLDGTGVLASFNSPYGIAVDSDGNIYVSDTGNHNIRKITSVGAVTTIAGTGKAGGLDGIGITASFYLPKGIAVDVFGNIYVAESRHTIRKITSSGEVTTLAGFGDIGFRDGNGYDAGFYNPCGVAVDVSGNVYVTDKNNHTIRKITSSGDVTTLAGLGGLNGDQNGVGMEASFSYPEAISIDGSGNLYVYDDNRKIRKITQSGLVTTFAGSGIRGSVDGPATEAQFYSITGIASNKSGDEIYLSDYFNNKIRKILSCSSSSLPSTPLATIIQPTPSTPYGSITVTSPIGDFDYSIDNVNYQSNPQFDRVPPGSIQLTARKTSSTVCVSPITTLKINVVPVKTVISSIESGFCHVLNICNNGTVNIWGAHIAGPLANDTRDVFFPVLVNSLTEITALASTDDSALALKSDGTVWSWGSNTSGELGNGTNISSDVPTQVLGLSGITAITGGKNHFVALKNDGTVWTWGDNISGQLGIGTTVKSNIPVQVSGLTNITALAGGGSGGHSFAIKDDGTVWGWGANHNGQLGNMIYNGPSEKVPVQITTLNNIKEIVRGDNFTLALKNDGTVWAFGGNEYGELANGTNGIDTYSGIPTQIKELSDIITIDASYTHAIALKNDGTAWTWGKNHYGELGNGTNLDSNIPVMVSGLTDITQISIGSSHAHAIKKDGSAWSWGNCLGNGSNTLFTSSNVPVQVIGLCVDSLGTEDNFTENTVTIYPNPSNGIFQLTVNNMEFTGGQLEIYDVLGKKVYAASNIKQQTQINLSTLSKGIYFIKVYNGAKVYSMKIIIE